MGAVASGGGGGAQVGSSEGLAPRAAAAAPRVPPGRWSAVRPEHGAGDPAGRAEVCLAAFWCAGGTSPPVSLARVVSRREQRRHILWLVYSGSSTDTRDGLHQSRGGFPL